MSYFLIFLLFVQNYEFFMRLLKRDKSHLPTGTYGSGNTKPSCLIEQLIVWDPRAFPTDFLGQFLVFLSHAKIWNMESQGPLQASVAFSSCEQTAPERHKLTKESRYGFPQVFIFSCRCPSSSSGITFGIAWDWTNSTDRMLSFISVIRQILTTYRGKDVGFMVVNISNV